MSYHQSVTATHLFHCPEARPKRVLKATDLARSSIHARASRGYVGMMGKRIARLISFVATKKLPAAAGALAVIGLLIWFLPPFGKGFTLTDLLNQEGYLEAVPPAEFYLPGTINTIEVRIDGKIALHPTCKIDSDLLAKITLHSHTIDRTWGERLSRKFDVSDAMKELVSFGVAGEKAKKFNLSLQNSSILQITDEDLMLIQHEVIKGPCREAIEWNINSGARVCQTRAALMADLVYDVIYEQGISVHEKGKLTADMASMLKIEADQENGDRLVGKGLIFGVKFVPRRLLLDSPNAKTTDCQVS